MWLFFSLILLSPLSFAADCTSASIGAGGTYNCDNLTVDTPINLTGLSGTPVVINVSGTTQIRANVFLNGAAGVNTTASSFPGAQAGPGGWNGGGISLGSTEDGGAGLNFSTANGKTTTDDTVCANGGGGAGFSTPGSNGQVCPTSNDPSAVGLGGTVVPPAEFDFGAAFQGGFGGGAGAFSTPIDLGTGGGGGGALHINSTGDVTISAGVIISARGGDGGPALSVGGGGGAGSGGAIWIQSAGRINNLGTVDVRGGSGGRNTASGASGGNAGDGVFRLQDSQGTTDGTGVRDFDSSGASKYKSDISCGTLAVARRPDLTSQMLGTFLITIFLGMLVRILSRFPKRI